MAYIRVCYPHCSRDDVVKRGKTRGGKQRFLCRWTVCPRKTFLLDYGYRAYAPGVKQQIVDMALNGSGIRDTARVLKISPGTVISEPGKQQSGLETVNRSALKRLLNGADVTVVIKKVEEAEPDEMWSHVEKKCNPRWLWHAMDHVTGDVLAHVSGNRKDKVFPALRELLEPFGIQRFYTDDWGAYDRHLPGEQQIVGKRNTQKIEPKHLTLRTRIKRLARKNIRFSKRESMHDIVIGLFINRHEFGVLV